MFKLTLSCLSGYKGDQKKWVWKHKHREEKKQTIWGVLLPWKDQILISGSSLPWRIEAFYCEGLNVFPGCPLTWRTECLSLTAPLCDELNTCLWQPHYVMGWILVSGSPIPFRIEYPPLAALPHKKWDGSLAAPYHEGSNAWFWQLLTVKDRMPISGIEGA